jgi:hypothetical protein
MIEDFHRGVPVRAHFNDMPGTDAASAINQGQGAGGRARKVGDDQGVDIHDPLEALAGEYASRGHLRQRQARIPPDFVSHRCDLFVYRVERPLGLVDFLVQKGVRPVGYEPVNTHASFSGEKGLKLFQRSDGALAATR